MSPGKITFRGLSFEDVPGWGMTLAIIAAIILIAVGGWYTFVRDPERALVTLREANETLREEMAEYNQHIAETPESTATLLDDARGKLVTMRYRDGCVLLARTVQAGTRSKLIVDLARDQHNTKTTRGLSEIVAPTLEAAGRCLNPHPGRPNTWNDQKQGCWIPVWRQWPDGCKYVQMFDSCHGTWDANVKWVSCVH